MACAGGHVILVTELLKWYNDGEPQCKVRKGLTHDITMMTLVSGITTILIMPHLRVHSLIYGE